MMWPDASVGDKVASPTRRGLCLVIAAPSGCGKTTVAQQILATDTSISQSISATTRAPRPLERDGMDYHFVSQDEFDHLVSSGGMLEHATVFGRSYGIPSAPVFTAIEGGADVLLVIDWQGHRRLLEELPGDVVGVFLCPPSLDELRRRMRARGDTEVELQLRMDQAENELSHANEFEHIVVNDVLPQTVSDVRSILKAARLQRFNAASCQVLAP